MKKKEIDDCAIRKELYEIVKIHNKGIELAKQLENILNFLLLAIYTVNILILCLLMLELRLVRI